MIAKLTGIIDSILDDYLIIDVNGVGYKVNASAKTLSSLITSNPISMLIETIVREDAFLLYGFKEELERYWFNVLINVQGVGAKVALGILSTLSPDEITLAIASGDKASLGRASGVGPKLAARLVTELKDKVKNIALAPIANTKKDKKDKGVSSAGMVMEESLSALVNLGYARMVAMEMVGKILSENQEATTEEIIKLSLRELSVK